MTGKVKTTESAGGVVLNDKGLVLVVSQHGTSWSLPKGHIDPGEDTLSAARREIYEESGLKNIELVRELGSYGRYRIGENGGENKTEYKTIHMFLFKTKEKDLKPVDPHNPEARWVDKHKVAEMLTHPKDREFFNSLIEKI
jgi:8-oxo-dGTP pyrophosphatase MutT (NUDIX family)